MKRTLLNIFCVPTHFLILLVVLSLDLLISTSAHAQAAIDLSKPVGSPGGSGQANGAGGVSYSIPIDVLPGTGGMQPSVSLNYSSQGGDGNFGWGWNLSAFSVISRAGKTQYYNGSTSPVSYTNTSDAFVLDGQRLFAITGNNGANNTIYGTENEGFAKIESFGGSEINGPSWFRVTAKDGKILEYGNATNTKLYTDNGQSTMIWLLNKVTDMNGNFEKFIYQTNNTDRNIALLEITYTGNLEEGLLPYNKVKFAYNVKPGWSKTKQFQGGASVTNPFLLSTVSIVNAAGTTVKSYQCAYNTLQGQYFLESLTETGADGISLNPLKFTYGANINTPDVAISPSYGQYNYNNTFTGDITGDGKEDVVAAYLYYDNNGIPHYSSYSVLDDFGSYNGQAAISLAYTYYLPPAQTSSTRTSAMPVAGSSYSFLTYDYDGDTKKDVLFTNWLISGTNLVFSDISINYSRYYSATSGPTYNTQNYTSIPRSYLYAQDFKYAYQNGTNFIPGDFDGDGAMDYILVLGINATSQFKAFFSSPKKGIVNSEILSFGVEGIATDPFYANSVASTAEVVPMDFDGDGKTEILVQKGTQSYVLSVYPVSGSPGYSYAAKILHTTTSIKSGYRVMPGDFNGDGATDLLVRASKTDPYAAWTILYSTGTSFKSFPFIFSYRPTLEGDGGFSNVNMLMVGDLNGDGKSDIWQALDRNNGTLQSYHVMYYSGGIPADGQNSTTAFTAETYIRPESTNKSASAQTIVGDINGDGKPDIMSLLGTRSLIIYPKPFKEDHLLVKATDGFGAETSFNWALMNSETNYQRSAAYYYDTYGTPIGQGQNGNPYMVVNNPAYLLSQQTVPNGIGGLTYTTYNYKDAAYSTIRGFLGYKEVSETSSATGITNTSILDINTDLLVPYLVEQTSVLGTETLADTKVTSVLARVSTNFFDKRYTSRVSKTLSLDGITGSATESTNTYDSYSNITGNVTKKGYLSGTDIVAVETTTTNTVFTAHASTPVPALPQSVTVSNTRSGQTTVSKQSTFTYDAKGNLATSTSFAGTGLATTTTQTLDGFGNITQVVVAAPATITPTVKYTYDFTGRFVTKKEVVGSGITKTENFTYEPLWGLLASSVTTDGLTTSYTYNGLGNITKTTLPDGNEISQNLNWENTGNLRYSTSQQRVADGGLYQKEYYDILSRKVKTEKGGFGGQNLISTTTYNFKGQVASGTDLYYATETPITNTITYDSYGRVTQTANGTTTVNLAYQKLGTGQYKTTTTNGASQATSQTQDAAGRKVNSIDNGGQLNFIYDSWGNKKSVQLGPHTLISSVFDAYGRQTSMTDKNAGTTVYEYNALGRLTKQTDAKGNIYTVGYDAFGRITSRTGPDGTTTTTYYNDAATGKNNDNISSITGPAGDVTNYVYDNLGRPTTQTVVFDGNTFTKTLEYDSYGNLIKTTYPSGVIINDSYNKNGILTSTTMGSGAGIQTLFTATAMNSKNIYTGYSYGNGKATTITYDLAKGAPSRYYTPGIQDLNFVFNAQTGNLDSRRDAIKNLTETFTYDNLNRLTGASVNNVQQFGITYDNASGTSLGNIATKTDIGSYAYDNSKIHAVKNITSINGGTTAPAVISQNQQDITYTPFLKAATITENNNLLTYTYGQDQQRIKSVLKVSGTVVETRYYLGVFERQIKLAATGASRDIHYINAGNGLCAIIVKEGSTVTPYFAYTDHLGSILTLTNTAGLVQAEQNFDAWGRNRNPANWTYASVPTPPVWLYRGYTGHEHLPAFALINMNGRMYDPAIGRMLSPDNYVPMPWSTQGYNRYGYVNNNPLVYTDPDGEFLFVPVIIGALVGAYMAGTMANHTYNPGQWDWNSGKTWGYIAGGAVIGGVSAWAGGAVAAGIGQTMGFAGAGSVAGAAGGAVGGAISGGGFAALGGRNVGEGIWKGALSGLIGGGVGAYMGGGVGAFAGGATSGVVGSALYGGDIGDIASAALLGGSISWGGYQISQGIAYHNYKTAGGNFTYKQFSKISVASQRSFARGKEFGGWILNDGDIAMWDDRAGGAFIQPSPRTDNVIGEFHTHPNWGGNWVEMHSPPDMQYAVDPSYVIGRQNVWFYNPGVGSQPSTLFNSTLFNVYPYNLYWLGR